MAETTRICSHCGKTFQGEDLTCPADGFALFEAPDDEHVGKVLSGQFRLESLLGAGAFGRVYTATDLAIGRRVAIKLLRLDVAGAKQTLQRFFKEAKVLASLKHKNIVAVHHLFQAREAGGAPALVMEFIEGQPLENLLDERGPFPWRQVADFSVQVCEALAYTHRKGIIHRDLKPANVMVCQDEEENGVVKVLDFGIAKMGGNEGESLTATGALLGTPAYMSPEQVSEGSKEAGPWTDIYALAVIMYEALSGRRPHTGSDTRALLQAKVGQPPKPLVPGQLAGDVPIPLANLIMSMLRKTPAERPRSAEVVRQQLEQILAAVSGKETVYPTQSNTLNSPSNLADLTPDAGVTVAEGPVPAVALEAAGEQDTGETKGYEKRAAIKTEDKPPTSVNVIPPQNPDNKLGRPGFVWPVAALLAVIGVMVVWQPWKEMLGSASREDVRHKVVADAVKQADTLSDVASEAGSVTIPAGVDVTVATEVLTTVELVVSTGTEGDTSPGPVEDSVKVADVIPAPPAVAEVKAAEVAAQPPAEQATVPESPAVEPLVATIPAPEKESQPEETPEAATTPPKPLPRKKKEPSTPALGTPDKTEPADELRTDPAPVVDPPKPELQREEEKLEETAKELRKALDSKPSTDLPPVELPTDERTAPAKSHHDSMRDKLDDALGR